MPRPALVRHASACVCVLALALSGCIKEKDDVTLKADGSGTYTETMTIDLSAMKGIADAMKGAMGGDEAGMEGEKPAEGSEAKEEKKEDTLEDLKKSWKEIPGLEVTKATSEEKDGKTTISVEAKFKALEDYARATNIEMSSELKKNEDGSWTLRFFSGDEKPAAADAAMEEGAMEDPGAEMAAAMMPLIEKFLADLEITRTLALPGKIVETNGTKADDGSSVTWKVTFADLKGGKMPAQTVTFSGEGLDLKPFSITRTSDAMGGLGGEK